MKCKWDSVEMYPKWQKIGHIDIKFLYALFFYILIYLDDDPTA